MLSGTDTWNRNTLFSYYTVQNRSLEQTHGTHLEQKCVPNTAHVITLGTEVWNRAGTEIHCLELTNGRDLEQKCVLQL